MAAAYVRHPGPPLPAGRTPTRPMSARVRRSTESAGQDSGRARRSVMAVSDSADSNFKALDISFINGGRHQNDKIDTFNTPSRNSQPAKEATASATALPSDVQSMDRGFLYSLQEKILASLRLEVREEVLRLRQSCKKAFHEAKEELLMDLSAMQQSPAAVASKILGAVWEVLEEVKESKDKLSMSDILQTMREQRKEVDLSEVLASMEDIKRRLDLVRLTAPLSEAKDETDLSEVLSELRALRARADAQEIGQSEVLTAVRESHREVDVSGILVAITEQGSEVSAAIRESGREVFEELRKVQASAAVDLSPVLEAIDDVREAEARTSAALAELAARDAGPPARAPAPPAEPAVGALRTEELLAALRAEREELRQAIGRLAAASPRVDLSEVVDAIGVEKESVLDAIGSLQAALLDEVRDEAAGLIAGRAKLAKALTAQEQRRIEGEQDIRAGLEVVRDLRKTVTLDLQPVMAGLEHSEVKMARLCELLMAKLEQQHVEVVTAMQQICTAGNRCNGTRRSPLKSGAAN